MTNSQKQEIQTLLHAYVEQFDSQAKACASLQGVSEGTIVNMRAGKWDNISANMWRNVGKQVGWDTRKSRLVETMDFQTLILYFTLARENGAWFAITGKAGFGKSYAGKWYRDANKGRNVYYIPCAAHWNRKYFLVELMESMGLSPAGMNIYEMLKYIISELRKQDHPLFILDEIDKLPDNVLFFLITIYNELDGLCGMVWTSTDAIKKRITNGIRLNKPGYAELFRRVGGKFIELIGTNKEEATAICQANGLVEAEEISEVYNEYAGDISRIDRAALRKRAKESMNKVA